MGVGKKGEGVVVSAQATRVAQGGAAVIALADVLPQKFNTFFGIVVEGVRSNVADGKAAFIFGDRGEPCSPEVGVLPAKGFRKATGVGGV